MFNWREVPFVRLLMPLLIGIALGLFFNIPLHFLNLVIFLLLGILAFMANRKLKPSTKDLFSGFVHLCIFLIGYQLSIYHNDFHRTEHFRHQLSEQSTFIGVVKDVRQAGRFLNTTLAVEQIAAKPDSFNNVCGKVMLSIDQAELEEPPKYGDRIVVSAKIKSLSPPKNPNTFDYRHYLRIKGIYHQAFVRKGHWEVVESDIGNSLIAWTGELRKSLLKTLDIYLTSENEYAVGAAMLLGFRDGMSDEIKNAYAGTGATHVMAVSGLHIGLVFLGLGLLLRLLFWRNKFMRFFKPIVMLLGIWLFALLSGASPSAMRAAFMFSLIIISQSLNREGSIYNTLASSAFCLLCYDPFLLMEVGFQLSYLAVIGIVYFQPKVYKLWYIENRVGKYIWQMASVGLAAQLMTFPLSLFYFHQFPIYFWLSGLIVVPAATFIIGIGALLFFSHYYLPFLSPFIGKILLWVITAMNGMIFLIRKLPSALIDGIWISMAVFILSYFIISVVVFFINSKKSPWLVYALGLFTVIMGTTAFTSIQQQDQSEMIVYHTPNHTLIDFINGTSLVTFHDDAISKKKKKRASANHRSSVGIKEIKEIIIEKETEFENNSLKFQKPFLQFHKTKMAIIDSITFQKPAAPIELDYLLLYNNPKYSISTLQEYFNFDLLIICPSNTKGRSKKWMNECEEIGIPYHNIFEKGAFLSQANPQNEEQ